LYSKKKAPPFEAKFQEMLNFEGPVWNGGFPKEKQRNEFHRKVFLTCCLERRKPAFLSKGKGNLCFTKHRERASKEI
jgi:hypothetical protein